MKRNALSLGCLLLIASVAVGACAPKTEEPVETPAASEETAAAEPMAEEMVARAVLQGREGSGVSGEVIFAQMGDGPVSIAAHVEGAAPAGDHGFHLHEVGDCSAADFTSAGGHFNPTGAPHGGPADAERHAGDLGNITIGDAGTGHLALDSDMITLGEGDNGIVGRAVVLHEGTDDLTSQPTGAAGGRLACGVITLEENGDGMAMGDEGDEGEGESSEGH